MECEKRSQTYQACDVFKQTNKNFNFLQIDIVCQALRAHDKENLFKNKLYLFKELKIHWITNTPSVDKARQNPFSFHYFKN